MKDEVLEVDENEIKEVLDSHKQTLDEHGKKLEKHDGDIQQLKIDQVEVKSDLSNIKSEMKDLKDVVTRFETNYYQATNSMMQTMSQLVMNTSNNNTEITKTNSTNRKDIIIKILGVAGVLIGAFLTAKYGIKIPAIM